MKNKSLIIVMVLLAVFIGGAALLYKTLAPQMEQNNLVNPDVSQSETGHNNEEADSTEQNEADSEPEKTEAFDFVVYDAQNNEVKLSDYIGKPIILNFWASWCGPCKSEMPAFEEKYKEYGDEIQFMMVNVTDGDRDTFDSAVAFIEDSGYTFPAFYDTQLDASGKYYVYYLPTTYFIDADGYLVTYATSALSEEVLQTGIDMIYKP
ncbi:MAG: TlpA family protein disulfide reductase [Ruminococcaceae bacterium]|nr:TlpA family protein disulfide reductase [Oscillospiraceae bacterium]